jgi:hypothetical protein
MSFNLNIIVCKSIYNNIKILIYIFFKKVIRLVSKLKSQMNFEDKSPERHSIHGNSPSPVRH